MPLAAVNKFYDLITTLVIGFLLPYAWYGITDALTVIRWFLSKLRRLWRAYVLAPVLAPIAAYVVQVDRLLLPHLRHTVKA